MKDVNYWWKSVQNTMWSLQTPASNCMKVGCVLGKTLKTDRCQIDFIIGTNSVIKLLNCEMFQRVEYWFRLQPKGQRDETYTNWSKKFSSTNSREMSLKDSKKWKGSLYWPGMDNLWDFVIRAVEEVLGEQVNKKPCITQEIQELIDEQLKYKNVKNYMDKEEYRCLHNNIVKKFKWENCSYLWIGCIIRLCRCTSKRT